MRTTLSRRGVPYRGAHFKTSSALEIRHDRMSGKRKAIAGDSLKWLDRLLAELKPQTKKHHAPR